MAFALCGAAGERIDIQAKEDAALLVLSGEPLAGILFARPAYQVYGRAIAQQRYQQAGFP